MTRVGVAILAIALTVLAVFSALLGGWALATGGAGAGIVGAIILGKRPGNGVGRALLAFGVCAALTDFTTGYMERWLATGPLPLDRLMVTIGASVFGLVGTTGCALFLVYPSGRARGRWRWVLRSLVAVGIGGALLGVAWASTRSVAEVARAMVSTTNSTNPAELAAAITFAPGFPLSVASLFTRYRSAGLVEKLQIRWLGFAASFLFVLSAGQAISGDFESTATKIATAIAFALFPIAIGVAITRYRLFEIDRIISRTVSYGLLTATLVAVYLGMVFFLRDLLPFEGGLPVATSTLAAAALFNPLRRRVQTSVDRRFNRQRYDAERVMGAFSNQLRGDVDPSSLNGDVISVVTRTVQPAAVGLWLRGERST
ncbi:MAG: hypothetical protein WD651_10175 [Acidimicrobiia bacterium]